MDLGYSGNSCYDILCNTNEFELIMKQLTEEELDRQDQIDAYYEYKQKHREKNYTVIAWCGLILFLTLLIALLTTCM